MGRTSRPGAVVVVYPSPENLWQVSAVRKLAVIMSFPVLVAAFRLLPLERLPNTCAFFWLTGYPCATCGLTRALAALAHLDFARAVRLNPLAPALVGGLVVWWSVSVYQVVTGRRTRIADWAARRVLVLVLVGLGVLLVFGAGRIAVLALR